MQRILTGLNDLLGPALAHIAADWTRVGAGEMHKNEMRAWQTGTGQVSGMGALVLRAHDLALTDISQAQAQVGLENVAADKHFNQ
jgi:hypothetical protein